MANTKSEERMIDRLDRYAQTQNLTDAQITRHCGLAIGTLGKSRKAGKDLSRRTAATLLARYPDINADWFTTGEGPMLRQPGSISPEESLPLIDTATAECGQPGGLSTAAMEVDCPRVAIPGVPRDTDFFIRASGYSMVNDERPELSIPPGAFVGISKLNAGSIMRWGEVYLLSTIDGYMIKRLLQDPDPDFVRCASYNKEEYPEFRLPKCEIIECGRITCVMPIYLR